MTLEERQEAIVLLKKTQVLIKNLNEQSRRDHSLYVCTDLYDDVFEYLDSIINKLGETTVATAKLICIEGYWNEPHKPKLEERCLVMPLGLTDSMRDVVLNELINKDNLFYIFDAGDRIMGVHKGFTVTFINPIYEVEVPAVC